MRRWGQTTPRGISAVESHKFPVIKLSQNKGEQTIFSQQDNLKIEKESTQATSTKTIKVLLETDEQVKTGDLVLISNKCITVFASRSVV